jgi:type I restriction enzyme S subunit
MTANGWLMTPFGDVLQPVSRPVTVEPDVMYRILGMRWYAQGLFLKEAKPGSEIRANELYRVELGDFVYNRLFAWKGSFGIVEADTVGGCVSGEFPCFQVDRGRADAKFLLLYLSQEHIWQGIERISSGQTNISRLRLKEPVFLAMEIPLPPLTEQRRIVARIEELAAKIEEARGLHRQIEESTYRLLLGAYAEIIKDAEHLQMREVAPITRRPVTIDVDGSYPELGVRSFGKGTFHKPALNGGSVGSKKLFGMKPDDLLFNNVFAWEGAVAVVKPEDQGRVGSHRFIACVPQEGVATSEYLCFHFLTRRGLEQLGDASPGGAGRNRTLGLKALEDILVPVPAVERQFWFTKLLTKVAAVKQLQAETSAELDALLPSVLDKAFKGEL